MSSAPRLRLSLSLVGVSAAVALGLPALASACNEPAAEPQKVESITPPNIGGTGGTTTHDDSGTSTTTTSDAGGSTTVLATGVYSPQALALDSTSVYWTTSKSSVNFGLTGDASAGTGAVEKVSRSGGVVTGIVAGLISPASLAVSGTTIFFSTSDGAKGVVVGYTQGATTDTQYGVEETLPIAVVANAGVFYWAGNTGSRLDVQSVSAVGGSIGALANQAGTSVPQTMVTDGASLYILSTDSSGTSTIDRTAIAGGATTQIWQGTGVPTTEPGLALNGDSLYWTVATSNANGGEILSASTSGGTVSTLVTNLDTPAQLAYDSGALYFTQAVAGGAVLSVSVGGGSITTLATGLDYPTTLVVDDAVYVGTETTVTRVAK